jgi:hypothetical protein
LTEKSQESIDNREWLGLMKSMESSPSVGRRRKHPEVMDGGGSPLVNVPSKKVKHQESFADSDSRWASTPSKKSKYQTSAEEFDSPLTSMHIRKGKYQAIVEDAPSPPASRTKMKSDRQEVIIEGATNTGEDSRLNREVEDQDDKVVVPEIITQQKFDASGVDILDDTLNPPTRPRLTIHDSAIEVLRNVRKSTASPRKPGGANKVLIPAEPVSAAANEAAKGRSPAPIESRAGPTTYGSGSNVLEDIRNRPIGPQLTIHDSTINILKDVRDPPEKAPPVDDNSVRHPLKAIDDTPDERDSLQPRIHDSNNHGFENEADSPTTTIEDAGIDFVDDGLEASASPDLTYHDSAIDVSNDIPNDTFYDLMKDITSSPLRPDPIAATFTINVPQEIQKPPSIFWKKRKERADSTGLDGDEEASSTVRSPVFRGRSRKRPLRCSTIDRLAEFPTSSPQRRKILVSPRYMVDAEEPTSQHKFQASVSRKSQELKGGGKLTSHIDYTPRITVSNHSHPTLAAAGTRSGSPESRQWYKLGMSLNFVDPGLRSGGSTIRIRHQLDGFEGVIEYKITACAPKIWPNLLNLTPEWCKVSDVDLTRSTVPFGSSTVKGWRDQFGLVHSYGNFTPSGTIKLKDLTPSDCTCCVPSQMHIQVLRDPRGSNQKSDEDLDEAWKKQLEEHGCEQKGPIKVQVVSKHDNGVKYNERPNCDPIRKRQCTKYQSEATRYKSRDPAFEYCCLDICSEQE